MDVRARIRHGEHPVIQGREIGIVAQLDIGEPREVCIDTGLRQCPLLFGERCGAHVSILSHSDRAHARSPCIDGR